MPTQKWGALHKRVEQLARSLAAAPNSPYTTSQIWAVQERVEQLARSLVAAKRNPKQASTLLNNATVRALIKQEDQLQMALGPMLHHGR